MTANHDRDAAVSFLKMASGGEVREAYSKFVGPNFRHHNPYFEGSAETLMAAMEDNARNNPEKTLDVKLAIAEGDHVAMHSPVRQNPESGAAVDIFRVEEGLIVELWDLGQDMPEQSPNQYGMF